MKAMHGIAWQRLAAAWGFNVPVLGFALRTAVAAFAAVVAAQALGLEHPHWAAMSAWASSQPMREHLLSRSFYRVAGSVVGVVYAVALVLVAQDSLWVLAIGLALWGAWCAWWGNAQRGYKVYGWMLAGYSAAMVVLLHHGPAESIGHLAWDRMWTVLTGVGAALLITGCLAPRRKAQLLITQSRQALAAVLQAWLSQVQGQPRPPSLETVALLSRLASVEELLELYPEGSRRAGRTAQVIHWQQRQAMELLYQLERAQPGAGAATLPGDSAVYAALHTLVQQLLATPQPHEAALTEALQQALAAVPTSAALLAGPALQALLQALQDGVGVEQQELGGKLPAPPVAAAALPLPMHRDWVGARQAGVRTGCTLLLVGALWAWTGSGTVAFGLLGLSVMLLVFSSFESPGRTMAFVLRGQIIGAVLALICQAWVWPWAQSSWQMVGMVLPFALIGGLLFAHRRTAAGALDTNMAMFILLAPRFPDPLSMGQHTSMALAIVAGPALAWVVFRCIYPTHAVVRMRHVLYAMWMQVPAAATQALQGRTLSADWQSQLHHRVLRVMRWADKTQWDYRLQLPMFCMALRNTQATVQALLQWQVAGMDAAPARTQRRAQLALRRLAQWPSQEARAATAPPRMVRAWRALAQQPGLPATLAAQVQQVAEQDLAVLAQGRCHIG